MPLESTIQKRMREPISGVTIIGKSDTNIVGPLVIFGNRFTPRAINNPKIITKGVTTAV